MVDIPAFRDLWLRIWPTRKARLKEIEGDLEGPDPTWRSKVCTEAGGFAVVDPVMGVEGAWMVEIGVVPEARGEGLGRRLYAAAVEGLSGEIFVRVAEDDEASLAFAERRGFVRCKLDFESTLDPRTAAPDLLAAWSPSEVEIVAMAELDSEAFRRSLHEFFEGVRGDVPRAMPPKRMAFEQFDAHVLSDASFCWEGSLVARKKGEIVGMSGVFRSGDPHALDQWLLAVHRDWRGRGLGRALKARGILWAQANGIEEIRTDNDSRNAPMLSINQRIGFVRRKGLWSLSKVLGDAGEEAK